MTPETLLARRYRLVRPIDRGGMGQVWAGVDSVLEREVAVKVVDVARDDPVAAGRFRREAQATAALSHPNVVTIYDLGVDGPAAFLVMELLQGPTVAALVAERGPLPVHEALLLAEQAAAGLSAAHLAGVVHRDVKPSNLMMDGAGRLKVVDFGIARLAQTTSSRLTATNTVLGSAHYLSPEQGVGSQADERTDLYALGCVLMTLLTGVPPFAGEHPLAVLHQHLNADPPRLSSRRADIPPELGALVGELLAKAPAHRPATAQEVQARLHAIRLEAAQPASTAFLGAPTAFLEAPARGTTPGHEASPTLVLGRSRQRQRPSRSSGRRAALGTAVVALLALLALLALRLGTQAPGPAAALPDQTVTDPVTRQSPATQTSTTPDVHTTAPSTTEALAEVRAAVSAAASSGQLTPSKTKEVLDRLDDLEQHLAEGSSEDAGRKLRELDRQLHKLARSGDLTRAALQSIEEPLGTLQNVLGTQD